MWGICEYKIKQDSKIFETVNIGAKIPNFLSLRNRSKEDKFLPRSSKEKNKKKKLEGVKGGKIKEWNENCSCSDSENWGGIFLRIK